MCLLALMGALMFVMQVAMAPVRNVHMTDVLIILTAVFFGWRVMYSVFVFVALEGLMWGFGLWVLSYMYLWPILAAAAVLMRKNDSSIVWAIVAALHGLFFGLGCSIPYLFIGGWNMAFTYFITGIPFDIRHCIGNFVLTFVLYRPLKRAMEAGARQINLIGHAKKRISTAAGSPESVPLRGAGLSYGAQAAPLCFFSFRLLLAVSISRRK